MMGSRIPVRVAGKLAADGLAVACDAVDELSGHDVSSRAAADRVSTDIHLGRDSVRARPADETVAAGAADEQVGSAAPQEEVVSTAAVHDVATLCAAKSICPGAARSHRCGTCSGDQQQSETCSGYGPEVQARGA